ncbi:hypothetical protein MN116_006645 [Schistosoma mekongi]|uniref:SAM domain-containing protein n=1 Tax=Schistosoma mekongi TaxID=38744 RepID=A0AAE2D3K9_SCHME|nr:hypothetical protein MN116_006645 [Schistosoma mekongi]
MSSGKTSVSQCNVTNIPTICLDNNPELADGYDSGLSGKSEEEFYITEEQAFGINELFYLSRLSCINNHKKFLIAIVLLSQCDEGYRRAAQQWLSNSRLESKEDLDQVFVNAEDSSYLKNLSTASASTNNLLDVLRKLTSLSGLQYTNEAYRYIRQDRVPVKHEHDGIVFHSNTRSKNVFDDSPLDNDGISQNFQSIKRQYLELVSKNFISSIVADCDSLTEVNYEHAPLREVAVQTSIGQLFIATILHASFNDDDRKWLLSSIRSKYKGLCEESNMPLKQGSTVDVLCSKLFDCLVDLGLDLSCVLQRLTSDSSLSHSLTSSGFLSGSAGSDSQYDLLEASNSGSQSMNPNINITSTKANFGALLTVPNAEIKCGFSNNFCNNHPYCPYPLNTSQFSHRRLSDTPRVSNYYFLANSQSDTQRVSNIDDQESKKSENIDLGSNQSFSTTSGNFNDLSTVSLSGHLTSIQNSVVDSNCGKAIVAPNVAHEQMLSICTLNGPSSVSSSNQDGICITHSPTSIFLTSTSPKLAENHENIVTYTDNSSLQFSAKTGNHNNFDNREFVSTLHSNIVNNRFLPSFNNNSHIQSSSQLHRQQLHSHSSMEFPEVQDESSHSRIPRNLHKLVSSVDTERVIEENNFLNPSSGMTAVPFWLKSLRLHKYTNLFRNLSYDAMMNITDDWLKKQNVTQGARNKILLSVEKLKHRKSALCLIEKSLSDLPSTDQLAQTTLQSCLSDIKHILLTPIKPFFKTTTHSMCQLNSYSSTATRNSSSSIPASACVVATNLEMPTTIQTATSIIDSTCPTSVSPSTIYVGTIDSSKNEFNITASNNTIKNCNNDCFDCSTNTLNHTTNDSNLLDYCCICNANSLYAENKCYLNEKKQQLNLMTNHANHVLNDSNDKCWSPSMISNHQVHSLPSYANGLRNESKQNECSDYGSDECADQKRINDNGNTNSDDNIPGQIIACLTKVCSSLLVAAYPGTHLYEEFLQILEIILNHVAFCEHQKKLVSYWKHRVIIVYVQYITQLPNSSKSKSEFKSNIYSRHLPHAHHSDSRLCKLSDTGQEQQLGPPTASRTIHLNTVPPFAVCLHNTQGTSYFTQGASDMPQPITDTSYAGANMSLIIPGAVEASRRHSTSVDDSRNFLAVGRLNNRRRMPSPNSSCFSGRSGLSTNLLSNNSSFSRHPQASSDMELSGFPSQLPRPRFHSPSRFDPLTNITPRRNLMPVATAPVTRMPSPSDVCRDGTCYNDWFTSNNGGAFSTVPLPPNMSPISACEQSCSENIVSDTPLIQRPRTPNVPASMLPSQNSFHKTHSSCSCTPTTSTKLTIPQILTLTSPTHMMKAMHQHIHPNYYETSGNLVTSFNYAPVPCISNPIAIDNVYHSTFGSLHNQPFCDNPQQRSIDNSNCSTTSTTKSPQSYFKMQQIDSSNEVPEIYNSCWSTDLYSHQINRGQAEIHGMLQCMDSNYVLNNYDNGNNNGSLVFVDNYIATAENNMISDPSDSSNDRINRDLDLLTRKVTEHAIGGFDSMTD